MNLRIVLASASPRRRELLRQIVPDFETAVSEEDERSERTDPAQLVRELAERKAKDVSRRIPGAVVIGADTVVARGQKIYGKPKDRSDAERMLRELSGRTHSVFTGVCVIGPERTECWTEEAKVRFFPLTDAFLRDYLDSGIPMDKAGAYGIQCTPSPVREFEGEYETIVGLPLVRLREVLTAVGLRKDGSV